MKKSFLSILIVLIIFSIVPTQSMCLSLDDITGGATGFLDAGTGKDADENPIKTIEQGNKFKNLIKDMAGTATLIGIIFILIVGVYLGIKFMSDSTQQKAEVKESLVPFIVGAIVILGAWTIWRAFVVLLQ